MKNLILTTASVLVLSSFAGLAEDTNMNDPNAPQKKMEESSLAAEGEGSSEMMKTRPADGSEMLAVKPKSDDRPPMEKGKKKGKKKHTHYKKSSEPSTHGLQYPNEAEIHGVFVTFPPMDLNLCKPQSFCGKPECPYISYEGYFWYPEARQNLLVGYEPAQLRGMYWYPSHMHPHTVYTEKTPAQYTQPYVLSKPHPTDSAMYSTRPAPMSKKYHSAPEARPAAVR